jgi:predicted nuclease of predicted toxin-antitoxin system
MRIKLDENLPISLVSALVRLGHEVDTVPGEALAGEPDSRIWEAAQRDGRFLITQDLDFSDARQFLPGSHHGVLIVRLRQPGRRALAERVQRLFETEAVHT